MSARTIPSTDRLWTRPFVSLLLIGFLSNTSCFMLETTIPVFAGHLGGNSTIVGLTTTLVAITALVFRPVTGILLDLRDRKSIYLIGLLLFAIVNLALIFTDTIPVLLTLRIFYGIGFSILTTAIATIFSDMIPPARLGEGMGYAGVAMTAAQAVGPAFGLYMIQHVEFSVFFILSFGIVLIAALLSVFARLDNGGAKAVEIVIAEEHPPANSNKQAVARSPRPVLIERGAILPSLVMFFVVLPFALNITFLPMYALNRGIRDIGLFFTITAVTTLFTRPLVGKVFDRHGAFRVVVPGLVLIFLAMSLLSIAATLPMFLTAAAMFGFGSGSIQPVMIALAIRLSSSSRRGAANATFFCFLDLGIALGSIGGGLLIPLTGYSNIFLMASGCPILSFLLFFFVLERRRKAISMAKGRLAKLAGE